jgi:hypothetical protein
MTSTTDVLIVERGPVGLGLATISRAGPSSVASLEQASLPGWMGRAPVTITADGASHLLVLVFGVLRPVPLLPTRECRPPVLHGGGVHLRPRWDLLQRGRQAALEVRLRAPRVPQGLREGRTPAHPLPRSPAHVRVAALRNGEWPAYVKEQMGHHSIFEQLDQV